MGSISLGGPKWLIQHAYMICKCRYSQNFPRKIPTIPVPPNTKMPAIDERRAARTLVKISQIFGQLKFCHIFVGHISQKISDVIFGSLLSKMEQKYTPPLLLPPSPYLPRRLPIFGQNDPKNNPTQPGWDDHHGWLTTWVARAPHAELCSLSYSVAWFMLQEIYLYLYNLLFIWRSRLL